ncbi:hypothetical protein [Pseudomonas phage LY218]|nr:hypothetical protein [Pseudomonas phage LY218]
MVLGLVLGDSFTVFIRGVAHVGSSTQHRISSIGQHLRSVFHSVLADCQRVGCRCTDSGSSGLADTKCTLHQAIQNLATAEGLACIAETFYATSSRISDVVAQLVTASSVYDARPVEELVHVGRKLAEFIHTLHTLQHGLGNTVVTSSSLAQDGFITFLHLAGDVAVVGFDGFVGYTSLTHVSSSVDRQSNHVAESTASTGYEGSSSVEDLSASSTGGDTHLADEGFFHVALLALADAVEVVSLLRTLHVQAHTGKVQSVECRGSPGIRLLTIRQELIQVEISHLSFPPS